jgi:hypothetical protein
MIMAVIHSIPSDEQSSFGNSLETFKDYPSMHEVLYTKEVSKAKFDIKGSGCLLLKIPV